MKCWSPRFWQGLSFSGKKSVWIILIILQGFLSQAADLGSSKITAVRNTVSHKGSAGSKDADVGQTVSQGESVMTKESSLAEITAEDNSIIRLGAHSVFSYSSKERMVKLEKGSMLMHAPPGNGGATIESGGVTGAITGTTFMLTASPAKCSDCGQELRVSDTGKVICRDHPNNPPASGGFAGGFLRDEGHGSRWANGGCSPGPDGSGRAEGFGSAGGLCGQSHADRADQSID